MPILNVYSLPQYVDDDLLADGTAVVIDVLRATTTCCYALEAGAEEILPFLEVDDALAAASRYSPEKILLAGERRGERIDGFDLGNSPDEYDPCTVADKTILFTTTNGTRAMQRVRKAQRIYLASFVNASAVAKILMGLENIHLLCAGTDGIVGKDDVLLAGMLVERLHKFGGRTYQLNVQALTAKEFWMNAFALPQALGAEPIDPEQLEKELRKSDGAKNLLALGRDADILAAAQIDKFTGVPELDPKEFRIRFSVG